MVREYTTKLIEMAENEEIGWEDIARECLSYMSEEDVKDMSIRAELIVENEDC